MEGEIDEFFNERAQVIAREQYQSEQRYCYLFDLAPGPEWGELTDEQRLVKTLALQALAQRGYLILGA